MIPKATGTVLLVAFALCSSAQRLRADSLPPGSTFAPSQSFFVPPPNYKEAQIRWTGAVAVYQWWANYAVSRKVQEQRKSMISGAMVDAEPLLRWTGEGALFSIEVVRSDVAERNGQFIAQFVGDRAALAGIGSTPEVALYKHLTEAQVLPGVPAGYSYDSMYSGFIWVAKNKQGKLVATAVARGTAFDLNERLRSSYGDVAAKFRAEELTRGERYATAAREASNRIKSDAGRAAVNSAYQSVQSSIERVAAIDEQLRSEIEAVQNGSQAFALVAALQKVVTLAQLVNAANQAIKNAKFDASSAKDATEVVTRVRTYEDDHIKMRDEYQIEYKASVDTLQKNIGAFGEAIAPANPPAQLLNDLRTKWP